jgi:hypothetical protein
MHKYIHPCLSSSTRITHTHIHTSKYIPEALAGAMGARKAEATPGRRRRVETFILYV